MNALTILFVTLFLSALMIVSYILFRQIIRNHEIGKKQTDFLIRKMNAFPLSKMLIKKGVDIKNYIIKHQVFEIENQLKQCESCQFFKDEQCEKEIKTAEVIYLDQSIYSQCLNKKSVEKHRNAIKNSEKAC